MAELVFGMATSHAFALLDPSAWEHGTTMNRQMYQRKYDREAPPNPKLQQENADDIEVRYGHIRDAHAFLHDKLAEGKLDALVLIGDDQNEHFTEENLPAIAMYVGGDFVCRDRRNPHSEPRRYRAATHLAEHMLVETVEGGFDVNALRSFPGDELKAHAFGPVLDRLALPDDVPVVPVFVEAIHYPAPTPQRCYEFGKALRGAIGTWQGGERVAFCASGGLSHFSAGFPYKHLSNETVFDYGSIDEDYDRRLLDQMSKGDAQKLVELSSRDLLEHGEIEVRSWITGLGMVGDDAKAQILAYEPFYSGIMGMGVAFWDAERSKATAPSPKS